jgi:4-amino-4-deoxy-L-arabinose transferase-like glycosyltransferase
MSFRNKNSWFYILVTIILLAGIFLRFWKLNQIPPGVHYDEAYNGINALQALETHDFKVFYPDNTGREGLHINTEAIFISIFGNTSFGLRFANALWGSLTLIGFFLLLRQLRFSRFSILLGTFMLSFSFWHLVFSRTAYRAIMVPFVLVWMFYFLTKGINSAGKKRYANFILSGLFLGIGFNTYIAFRIAPLIFILMAAATALTSPGFFKRNWKTIFLFALVMLLVALPIFIYFADHFREFVNSSISVSV